MKMKGLSNRLRCMFGMHDLVTAGNEVTFTYHIYVGKKCKHCNQFIISEDEFKKSLRLAIQRGVDQEHTRMIAHADGLDEILRLYPNELERRGYVKK